MKRILLIFLVLLTGTALFGQDTLVTWSDEEILGKIVEIENKVVSIILPDEPEKTHRVSISELQRATYENGQSVYFFEKYPDIITKMKKAAPYRNMIEFGPIAPPFNHFYAGYERLFAKRQTYEVQAGIMAPMMMPVDDRVKGFHLNLAWKSIFTEPVKLSGMSVRPQMQGAYAGLMLSFNLFSYSQSVDFPTDTVAYYIVYDSRKTRVNVFLPTLHFVFGYNQMIAPALMLGFSGGIGGGPMMVLNSDETIRKEAMLPVSSIGVQRFIAGPFSLSAMLTVGYLFK